jgi:hypothetical protein
LLFGYLHMAFKRRCRQLVAGLPILHRTHFARIVIEATQRLFAEVRDLGMVD